VDELLVERILAARRKRLLGWLRPWVDGLAAKAYVRGV
jgi:hypothetical protein